MNLGAGCTYVVWSLLLLVWTPIANWSQARGQTKNGSKDLVEECGRRTVTLPRGSPGSISGVTPRRRTCKRAPGGQACHGARPGTARRIDVATTITISPSLELTTHGKNCWSWAARLVAVKAEGLDGLDPGSRGWLWGCRTSPLWEEGSRSL